MLTWFTQLSKQEKWTFWACFSGWGLDAMDTQMYALAIPTLISLWGMSKGQAGILGTAVLIMAALGGWLAGMLSDRIGRVRVLQITILWFSAFTFLSGLTNSFWELLAARSLQGIGFGGEWAVGSVLISEAISPRVRGRVVGAIQAGWAIGYGIAVLISTVLFSLLPADLAWRVFFFIGLLPALLVLWIRRNIQDAAIFRESRQATGGAPTVSVWQIFGRAHLATTLKATLLTTGIYGGNYVMITWLPAYLKMSLHLSVLNVGAYLAVNILGSFAGAFLNGWMADFLGRRKTFMVNACLQVIAVGIYTMAPINTIAIFFMGFVLGTLQSGTAAGTGAFLAELFPTHIRGTAQGFCGNGGRAIGAVMPALVGIISADMPLGAAMGLGACSAYFVVVVFAALLPETRGRDLRSMTVAADDKPSGN
ncbi:MFS transporter [Telmatospirillum siberiense]|uniref:MFS transporter n=1 Tax=Telmatospirillum siberiense TaxID=382514 RepID=A0A2N3Q0C2_9PROT|nr:MFS transporter [Telmatospirillum siberiense]PKU26100.1 MFS transporter [Telmatospirillum siberiense]